MYVQINDLEDEEIEDVFVLDRDMDGPDPQGRLHGEKEFRHLPEDLQEQIATLLKAVRKTTPEAIPDKRKRDEISTTAVHRALQLRLAQYPTNEAQDIGIAQDADNRARTALASGADASADVVRSAHRQKMATVVRVGEKNILNEAIQLAEKKLSELNESDNSAEPSAKRKKTSR